MNRIAKLSAIVALTALPFAGVSQAAGMTENWPKQIDSTVANYKNGNFYIVDVHTLNKLNETHSWIDDQKPDEQASFRQALEANPTLTKELQARNVELGNIVGAEQAADGSLTFYIR